MSSSNLVRVAVIEESTYGVTPVAGNFKTARFTSEKLSGSPDVVQSATIRSDRMSSGNVVSGLKVQGDIQVEVAKDSVIDLFLGSAMHNTWNIFAPVTVDLTIATGTKKITRATGSFVTDGIVVGDFVSLIGFATASNNTQIMVAAVSALEITYVGPVLVNEVGTGTSYDRADKLVIGQNKKSFTLEKTFLDLTTKALIYKGMAVDKFNINASYGSIVKATFGFMGNHYTSATAASEFATYSRVIDAAETTNALNGSIDMPFLASSDTGTLDAVGFCIQSVDLSLNNNLQAMNCIGEAAPVDYSSGSAQIDVTLSAYLSNANWSLLPKKLSQAAFALGFQIKNAGGFYAFYIPQIQISMDDPSSGGSNQQISLSMKGTAKVGATGESSLTIFRG